MKVIESLKKMVKITQAGTIESAENKNNYMDGSGSSRLVKLVTGLCIGQIVMGITTTTIVGVIVDRHVSSPFYCNSFIT